MGSPDETGEQTTLARGRMTMNLLSESSEVKQRAARRSDRIALGLRVRVSGTSGIGKEFTTATRTTHLSRHGAKILLEHDLVPNEGLNIGCVDTNKEADARLVGFMGEEPEGPAYGIEFLDREVNLWNILFPPVSESRKAVARALLQCTRCRAAELAYLNENEATVLQWKSSIPRPCGNCNDLCLWEQLIFRREFALPLPIGREAPGNTRRQTRFDVPFTACIRSRAYAEEVVPTGNISRGGLHFKSGRRYKPGDMVEVAIPYVHNSGNIFVPARIAYIQGRLGQRMHQYGISYVQIFAEEGKD